MQKIYNTNAINLDKPSLAEIIYRDKARFTIANSISNYAEYSSSNLQVDKDSIFSQILNNANADLKPIYQKIINFNRISPEEALIFFQQASLPIMGILATHAKEKYYPENYVSYLIDRNINYTNICSICCDFCAFYRKNHAQDAYLLSFEDISQKISETLALGGTGVLMQGGVHPNLKIDYFIDLFTRIKAKHKIHLHALSTIEVEHIAKHSNLSLKETLLQLRAAGLDSIPGAGAEVLVDSLRNTYSPAKNSAATWLNTMQLAHECDLPTSATMMFGTLETNKDIISHLHAIRNLQDKTQGFNAFIMWTFQGENTKLAKQYPHLLNPVTAVEYLKVVALSRIYLDNIPNIQGSWVTMGPKIGQTSLHFGANDLGSIMIEENVVRSAGTTFTTSEQELLHLIAAAGFTPIQRDNYYNYVQGSH